MSKTSRTMRLTTLGEVRFASVEDAPRIMELVNDSMASTFRVESSAQIMYLIENCVISIIQMDINEGIVGFLSLRDYPLIPSVHPQAWEDYIWNKYKSVQLNSRNTLFIHLACWNATYTREVIDNMLKSVFMHDQYVHHIAMVKSVAACPLLIPGQSRAEASFRRVNTLEKGMSADQLPSLYIADRKEVCPKLRIRRAVEEDNDDIVPILEAHSKRLRDLYGDFYISELVARHPESERVLLVCEHKEVAVGIMCLNTVINFEALEESFELSPFSGLRKLDSAPKKSSRDVNDSMNSTVEACEHTSALLTETLLRDTDTKSKVNWVFTDDEFRKNGEQVATPATAHAFHASTSQLDILQLLEDDEEEFEFDIVNIDTELLRVPELLIYDSLRPGTMNKVTGSVEDSDEALKKGNRHKGFVSTPSAEHKLPEPTRYSGAPNVFLVEIFAMHPDYDERFGFDMLEVAFEIFPNREYCMMSLPCNNLLFPLLEHFTLVTPFSSRLRFVNESLYVAHVNSVRGNMRVRRGEAYDLTCMYDVCEHAPLAQGLVDLFKSALGSITLECYVMTSENQPIGMMVIGWTDDIVSTPVARNSHYIGGQPGYKWQVAGGYITSTSLRPLSHTYTWPFDDSTAVRAQYRLEPEPRRPGTDGTILTGVVSPAFEPHFRWFMRELLRNSKYSTLFWISSLFSRGDNNPLKHMTSVAGHMTPLYPRHSIPNISGNQDLDKIYKDRALQFSLWMMERPQTSLPKVYVNNSIVVVGASRTGLAFLEMLILGPTCHYLTFSNLTLVSEHGLHTVMECLKAADTCVPRDGRYTDRYMKSVPFFFYVDVITAVMVGIDRKKKCIHLKSGGVKFYDELVLTVGQQFQHPDYLHGSLQLAKEVEQGKPCERLLMDNPQYLPDTVPQASELPDNVFLINSLNEANVNLRKLLQLISETSKGQTLLQKPLSVDNPVIVYGNCLEAYSCMAALLELGIFSEMICFVEPLPPDNHHNNSFNNETVYRRVQNSLGDLGITVYRQYCLTGWQHHYNHVDSVSLMSQLHYVSLPCFALFYYGNKAIDVSAFNAINKCGLVYDGGLVVNASFETNDPHVYGAGPCVKYSRRLYASQHAHQYYSAEDVGTALAKLFLKMLDPFVMSDDSEPTDFMPRYSSTIQNYAYRSSHVSIASDARLSACALRMPSKWQPVMKFDSAIVHQATLPGPLYYMKLRKPGVEIPMEVQMCLPHQGHTLITDKNGNYFRLQLNVLHCVDAVTCLSRKKFSCEVLSQLYGKHEAFFNKLLARFKMNLVPDLFDFFVQPWLSALYQESFADLLRDINEQVVGTDATNLGTFRSVIDRFVARKSFIDSAHKSSCLMEIPLECGQNKTERHEAADFWKKIGGDDIVATHLAKYLKKTSVINSHYAVSDPNLV